MSVSSMMTAIADSIRAIMGTSGAMGLEAMGANLTAVQSDLASAFTAVGDKGGTVPEAQITGNLASAIGTIPTGVTVQRKTGTFTTGSSGTATVSCGFQPDLVLIHRNETDADNGKLFSAAMAFNEAPANSNGYYICAWTALNNAEIISIDIARTTSGFTASIVTFDSSWSSAHAQNATFNYVAVKYTE